MATTTTQKRSLQRRMAARMQSVFLIYQLSFIFYVVSLTRHSTYAFYHNGRGSLSVSGNDVAPWYQAVKFGLQSALSHYGLDSKLLHRQNRSVRERDQSNSDDRASGSSESNFLQSTSQPYRHSPTFLRRQRQRPRQTNVGMFEADYDDDECNSLKLQTPNGVPTDSSAMAVKRTKRGATATPGSAMDGPRPLSFLETMLCGAISRSTAQTIMHPANTMKTMLQTSQGPMIPTILELMKPSSFRRLTYGAGTNFLLSVPQGALNFSVLELVRKQLGNLVASNPYLSERSESLSFGLDFVSSSVSTVVCSVVATPQMMITDNIMAGNYPNLVRSVQGLAQSGGIKAFYRGWLPAMAGKIPSYALTWTLFQQFKTLRDRLSDRPATNIENSIMGCLASATSVSVMIPMDTIKTRLVTQGGAATIGRVPYKGIVDCAVRVYREEGIGAFYRSLPPRLVSVVPLIGIQFGVYEAMKKFVMIRKLRKIPPEKPRRPSKKPDIISEVPPKLDHIEEETMSGRIE